MLNIQPEGNSQKKSETKKSNGSIFNLPTIVTTLLVIIVVALGGAVFYLFKERQDYKNELNKLQDPAYLEQIQKEQNQQIVEGIRKIMLLPEEEPAIFTIVDNEGLKKENPEFYKNSVNGDRILVFSKMAVIYRDAENKIINVAPVVMEENGQAAPAPEQAQPAPAPEEQAPAEEAPATEEAPAE
jgi:hypothetical protein